MTALEAPSVVGNEPGVSGLVSVVIPTFNRSYIIGKAIESVLAQSYRDVEIVVADDGSTDATEQVVAAYGSRVRYVKQANAGPSAARNLGMRHSRGEFIAFLDSDDEWMPWKLAVQVEMLRRQPDAGMVWTDMTAIDAIGHTLSSTYLRSMYTAYSRVTLADVMTNAGRLRDLAVPGTDDVAEHPLLHGDIFQYMLLGSLVHTSTVLLRRSRVAAIGGFDETLRVSGEDYEFHLRTCFGGPVAFVDAPSIRYRVGADDQLTGQRYMIHIARNNLVTLGRWLELGHDRISTAQKAKVRRSLGSANGWLGTEEFAAGNRGLARRHLWRSFRLGFWSIRGAALLALSICPLSISDRVLSQYRGLKSRVATIGSP